MIVHGHRLFELGLELGLELRLERGLELVAAEVGLAANGLCG